MVLRTLLTAIAGTVAMFVTNGIMAAAVIGPLFEDRYREIVADPIDVPLLVGGYLIIAVALAVLYPRLRPTRHWVPRSLTTGALVGLAAFLGTHTVIAGYTNIDATGFVLSGLCDSLGPMIGALTIGSIDQRFGRPV